ncbi:MAG: PAS domain S-box protein [Flavipsychrobacter sp.]
MMGQIATCEEKLQLAEMINDASIDRILTIDTSYSLISWNKTNEQVTGLNRNDILGKNIFEVIPQLLNAPECIKAIKHWYCTLWRA